LLRRTSQEYPFNREVVVVGIVPLYPFLLQTRIVTITMASIINDPQHWIERAREARELAEQMDDPIAQRAILSIGESYMILAKRAEERAQRLKQG